MFFWRLKEKYIIRNFHPLVFFYLLGLFFSASTFFLFIRLFYKWYYIGYIPPMNALAAMFSFSSSATFLLFAMWFDMKKIKNLR